MKKFGFITCCNIDIILFQKISMKEVGDAQSFHPLSFFFRERNTRALQREDKNIKKFF